MSTLSNRLGSMKFMLRAKAKSESMMDAPQIPASSSKDMNNETEQTSKSNLLTVHQTVLDDVILNTSQLSTEEYFQSIDPNTESIVDDSWYVDKTSLMEFEERRSRTIKHFNVIEDTSFSQEYQVARRNFQHAKPEDNEKSEDLNDTSIINLDRKSASKHRSPSPIRKKKARTIETYDMSDIQTPSMSSDSRFNADETNFKHRIKFSTPQKNSKDKKKSSPLGTKEKKKPKRNGSGWIDQFESHMVKGCC